MRERSLGNHAEKNPENTTPRAKESREIHWHRRPPVLDGSRSDLLKLFAETVPASAVDGAPEETVRAYVQDGATSVETIRFLRKHGVSAEDIEKEFGINFLEEFPVELAKWIDPTWLCETIAKNGQQLLRRAEATRLLSAGANPESVARITRTADRAGIILLSLEPGRNADVDVDRLMEECLDHFQEGVDPAIVRSYLKNGGTIWKITDILERVNVWNLPNIDQTIDAYTTTLLDAGVDPKELVDSYTRKGWIRALGKHLAKFSREAVNPLSFSHELIEKGEIDVFVENATLFFKAGMTPKEFILLLGENGQWRYLVQTRVVSALLEAGEPPEKLFGLLMERGMHSAIANHASLVPPDVASAKKLWGVLENSKNLFAQIQMLARVPPSVVDRLAFVDGLFNPKSWKIECAFKNPGAILDAGYPPASLASKMLDSAEYTALAHAIDAFPPGSFDAQALAEGLMNEGQGALLEKIAPQLIERGLDLISFATSLIKHDIPFVIRNNFASFLATPESVTWLERQFVGGRIVLLPSNVRELIGASLDPAPIAEYILSDHPTFAWSGFAETLSRWPTGSVDPTRILNKIKKLGFSTVMYFDVKHLLRLGIPPLALAKQLVLSNEDRLFRMLVECLPTFSLSDIEIRTLANNMAEGPAAPALATNLDRFVDCGLDVSRMSPRALKRLDSHVTDRMEIDAATQRRFGYLAALERVRAACGTRGLRPISFGGLRACLDVFARDNRPLAARGLVDYATLIGADLSDVKIPTQEITEATPLVLAPEQEPAPVAVHEDATRFYVNSAVRGILDRASVRAHGLPGRLGVRLALEWRALTDAAERETRSTADWMRRYLVVAVQHEMKHRPKGMLEAAFMTRDEIFRNRETSLAFFEAASASFHAPGWSLLMGGERWGVAADTAYALHATPGGPVPIIDTVFSLQHNAGAIFDKDQRNVVLEQKKLKRVLDAQFSSPEPEQFLASLPADVIPEHLRRAFADRLAAARAIERIAANLG